MSALLGAVMAALLPGFARAATTLTIGTVNNGDMIRMQKLTGDFSKANPDIQLQWVTLEENVLRQKVTTDIATKGGQYDIMTIGTYEVPIWANNGWLVPLDNLGADFDVDDLLPPIREALSHGGKLYAVPFYGESSFTMFRKDLMGKAALIMPQRPTWDFIKKAADKITDRDSGISGICLRGKAGWGENTALITTIANSFGARWFDKHWKPQFDTKQWHDALQFYVDLMKADGPAGTSGNGFNEDLTLFQQGRCGIWVDATVAGSFVTDPKVSTVADQTGFALAPDAGLGKRASWIWAWSLAIPSGSKKIDAAKKFVSWAASKHYEQLVAFAYGWANVPPGTRTSLYNNPAYTRAAPFAAMTLDSINAADPLHPTVDPVPYTGVQFVAIPEFQGLGDTIGQIFSAAVAGQVSVDGALRQAQDVAARTMTKAGYIK